MPPIEQTTMWIPIKIVVVQGVTTATNPDGTVRSLNPSHNEPPHGPYTWETRPAGTHGGYEACRAGNGTIRYSPLSEMLVFGFVDEWPNMPGFGGMTLEPLKL